MQSIDNVKAFVPFIFNRQKKIELIKLKSNLFYLLNDLGSSLNESSSDDAISASTTVVSNQLQAAAVWQLEIPPSLK